jgi:copper chaperone CopZ
MNSRKALVTLTAALVFLAMIGLAVGQSPDILKPGDYSAKVKAITCGGCGPLIKKTMQAMKEIESVTVDSEKKTVQFVVKKDNPLKLSELQKALNAAADKMGMGADYTLLDLKPTK